MTIRRIALAVAIANLAMAIYIAVTSYPVEDSSITVISFGVVCMGLSLAALNFYTYFRK
jgi:hypothetical protein